MDLHSVPHHDILTGRKFKLTFTTFPEACDLLSIFFLNDNRSTSNANEDEAPFHNESTWNPPNDDHGKASKI